MQASQLRFHIRLTLTCQPRSAHIEKRSDSEVKYWLESTYLIVQWKIDEPNYPLKNKTLQTHCACQVAFELSQRLSYSTCSMSHALVYSLCWCFPNLDFLSVCFIAAFASVTRFFPPSHHPTIDINHFKSNYLRSCEKAVKFLVAATKLCEFCVHQEVENEIKELPPIETRNGKVFWWCGKGNAKRNEKTRRKRKKET